MTLVARRTDKEEEAIATKEWAWHPGDAGWKKQT
jgi:hypothetical protein